jgi:voltage-dependent calcium channel T type alpha-1G
VQPDLNFDTTMNSMLTLVTIQSTEGWIGVMWGSVDAVGPYQSPMEGYSNFMIIYMIILIIIISLLFLNLFVGVVIETFNREKENLSFNSLLKPSQRSWIEV